MIITPMNHPSSDLQQAVSAAAQRFATEIVALATAHVVPHAQALVDMLNGCTPAAAPPPPSPVTAVVSWAPGTAARPKGAKRPKHELAAVTEALRRYIYENPGERIEPIGRALNMRTADLNLPIKKLIADKRIWAQGDRRATKYWPVTGDKALVKKTKVKAKGKAKSKAK